MTESNHYQIKWVNIILRILLGGLFIYAAIPKILDPYDFAIDVENYQILSGVISHYVALVLPWIELYCGLLLILNIWTRFSALIVSGLLVVFLIAILSAITRDLNIECGCFSYGGKENEVSWLRVLEDLILLAISSYLVFVDEHKLRLFSKRSTKGN